MDGSLSAIDTPALALFNPPAPKHRPIPLAHAPRHFVTRSVHNLRQGNFALFVVFCGCFIIFVRALFGAGYDEAFSADADAAVAKHPSLLQRWGPHSQHALEQQWQRLRGRAGDGLWAKIRKEDAGAGAGTLHQRAPGAEALHWLRVMEDKAMAGLGRRPHTTDLEDAAPTAGSAPQQVPVAVPEPEHDMSEDLDEHDVPDEDDLRNLKKADAAKTPTAPADAHPDPNANANANADADSDSNSDAAKHAEHDNVDVDVDVDAADADAEQSASSHAPVTAEVDPEHDDTGDEPVYHSPDSK